MKQVLLKQGQVVVEDVPAPGPAPGRLLVQVAYSCISPGTELGAVRAGGEPLWRRAVRKPGLVGRGLRLAATRGVSETLRIAAGRLSSGQATGYSAAGTVVAAGEGILDLPPGTAVACAGAQAAHHAEVISVPRHLAVAVPDGLDARLASTVALGAVALHGVRRARPTLGEAVAVLGLGIVGQLVAQLLSLAGCRVIGIDPDPARVRAALDLGTAHGIDPRREDPLAAVARITGGVGADAVVIAASTPSHDPVSSAFHMCRRKGRVVLVGDVGLHLRREDFYAKEIDVLISTSYGPGRYDPEYEEGGKDYPLPYVRWTETRNMAEYLRLAAEGHLRVAPLIGAVYPVDQAARAYTQLRDGSPRPLLVLLSYPEATAAVPVRTVTNPRAAPGRVGAVRLAVVGTGDFATGTHLPTLRRLRDLYTIEAVVSRSGHRAAAAAKEFGARYATTDVEQVLADAQVDAVLIATRHDLHAPLAAAALRAGKHVLVEKPLALSSVELDGIKALYADSGGAVRPILLTGFNRRFSPFARQVRRVMAGRRGPAVLTYRMNAGPLPPGHWLYTGEGGGRNLGEACHVYDLFTFLTDARITGISAQAIPAARGAAPATDNFIAALGFADGSLATLTYTALGTPAFPKERLEVFVDGMVIVLDDYTRLDATGAAGPPLLRRLPDKGHEEELRAFAQAVRQGGEWPAPLWQQLQATEIALRVEALIGGQS